MRRLFGTNGIRFILGVDYDLLDILKIGYAIGTFFGKGKTCLLGRDVRITGDILVNAISSSLMSCGINVHYVGYITTPALQWLTKHRGYDFSIMITASHNPPEFNGIKVIDSDGIEIPREKEEQIEKIYYSGSFKLVEWRDVGELVNVDSWRIEYVKAVLSHVNIDDIKRRNLNVVVDPANSVGTYTTPYALKMAGCKVTTINAVLDGTFPGRHPEPKPENLKLLSETVRALGADFGVAHDGDGDRAIFVDEKGEVHWGDESGALIVRDYLEKHPGEIVVTPVSSSKLIEDVARKYGGRVVYTRVGSIIVSRTMVKIGAKIGLEENGGIFYGPHHPVRDGTMAALLIANIVAATGEPLSKLFSELPKYYHEKRSVPCPHSLKSMVLDIIKNEIKGVKVETIDGVKVWFSDGSWVLLRPSGTEPLFRIYAESKDPQQVKNIADDAERKLRKIISEVKHEHLKSK